MWLVREGKRWAAIPISKLCCQVHDASEDRLRKSFLGKKKKFSNRPTRWLKFLP